jgi:hypothetical protein
MRLAWVGTWRPSRGLRVDLEQVERAILEAHQPYRLARLAADSWQAE